jgi:hypothetical protein
VLKKIEKLSLVSFFSKSVGIFFARHQEVNAGPGHPVEDLEDADEARATKQAKHATWGQSYDLGAWTNVKKHSIIVRNKYVHDVSNILSESRVSKENKSS